MQHRCWLSASYIEGCQDVEADQLSRVFNDRLEWQLDPTIFRSVCHALYCQPDIDLFVSRINANLSRFMSFQPDPHAVATDAIVHPWNTYTLVYLFPPFSLITKCLQKIWSEQATAVIITPL